jgi:3-dehydroquinate dehydratase
LLQLSPVYFDIEYDTEKNFIDGMLMKYPDVKIIFSYHNFTKTPFNLRSILDNMLLDGVSVYKIATKANSMLDSMRMLNFLSKLNSVNEIKLTGICMGDFGRITRLLSSLYGSFINYTYFPYEHLTAFGQISIEEMLKFFSLIGRISGGVMNYYVKKCSTQEFAYDVDQNVINIRLKVLSSEHAEICHILRQTIGLAQSLSGKLYHED